MIIWDKEEYSYPLGCGFYPNITAYLHEDTDIHPCMIIVPGGGYQAVTPTEGELVAKKFYGRGYQAFVLTYTTNFLTLEEAPLKLQPTMDLSRAVRFIRKNAEKLYVNTDQIVACGFSAGAHICGMLSVHAEDFYEKNEMYQDCSNKLNALILSYPVISMEEAVWEIMSPYVLGKEPTQDEIDYMSLEKQVKEGNPPCFIWQTANDELVSPKYSFEFANACKKHHVSFAYHVFTKGPHGMSTADEDWAEGKFGELYTTEQIGMIMTAVQNQTCPFQKQAQIKVAEMEPMNENTMEKMSPNHEVEMWIPMAEEWLKEILMI